MMISELVDRYNTNPSVAEQSQEAMQALLARSATDAAFRRRLLESPREALAEFGGRDVADIPAGLDVAFVENKAAATIVLPDFVGAAELSEEELEAVAGGTEPVSTAVVTWTVTAAVVGAVAAGITIGIEWHKTQCDHH